MASSRSLSPPMATTPGRPKPVQRYSSLDYHPQYNNQSQEVDHDGDFATSYGPPPPPRQLSMQQQSAYNKDHVAPNHSEQEPYYPHPDAINSGDTNSSNARFVTDDNIDPSLVNQGIQNSSSYQPFRHQEAQGSVSSGSHHSHQVYQFPRPQGIQTTASNGSRRTQVVQQRVPTIDTPAEKWFLPRPTRDYRGPIPDIVAFRESRNARPRQPGVLDENTAGFLEKGRKSALHFYDAFYHTSSVSDGLRQNGMRAQAVLAIEEGYWDDDAIWMASWKIMFDWLDVTFGAVLGGYVNKPRAATAQDSSTSTREPSISSEAYASGIDRFKMIHRNLWLSKAICKKWLDAELQNWQFKLIASPATVFGNKEMEQKHTESRFLSHNQSNSTAKASTAEGSMATKPVSRKRARITEDDDDDIVGATYSLPPYPGATPLSDRGRNIKSSGQNQFSRRRITREDFVGAASNSSSSFGATSRSIQTRNSRAFHPSQALSSVDTNRRPNPQFNGASQLHPRAGGTSIPESSHPLMGSEFGQQITQPRYQGQYPPASDMRHAPIPMMNLQSPLFNFQPGPTNPQESEFSAPPTDQNRYQADFSNNGMRPSSNLLNFQSLNSGAERPNSFIPNQTDTHQSNGMGTYYFGGTSEPSLTGSVLQSPFQFDFDSSSGHHAPVDQGDQRASLSGSNIQPEHVRGNNRIRTSRSRQSYHSETNPSTNAEYASQFPAKVPSDLLYDQVEESHNEDTDQFSAESEQNQPAPASQTSTENAHGQDSVENLRSFPDWDAGFFADANIERNDTDHHARLLAFEE